MKKLLILLLICGSAVAQPGIKPHAYQFLMNNDNNYQLLEISRVNITDKRVTVDIFLADSTNQKMDSGPLEHRGTYKNLFLATKNRPEFYVVHLKNRSDEDIYLYIETPGHNEILDSFFFIDHIAITNFKFKKGTYHLSLFDEEKENYAQLLQNVENEYKLFHDHTSRFNIKFGKEWGPLYNDIDFFLDYYDLLVNKSFFEKVPRGNAFQTGQVLLVLPKTFRDTKVSDTPLSIYDILTQRFNQIDIGGLKKLFSNCDECSYKCHYIEIYYHKSVINNL